VFGGFILLALAVLMLERLLRVAELVAASPDATTFVAQMMLSLVPHYLGIAIPISLLLSVLITVDRVGRSGELPAMLGTGFSLGQVARPFMGLAILLSAMTIVIFGYLQPISRFEYRVLAAQVEQEAFEAVFQEGRFARVGDRVFWTEENRLTDGTLGQMFVFDRSANGVIRVVTAPSGAVSSNGESETTQIVLNEGVGLTIPPEHDSSQQLTFDSLNWNFPNQAIAMRPRGDDALELTLGELLSIARGAEHDTVDARTASAMLHSQFGRAAILLFLPFLAIPLGLGYGRSFQSIGLGVGIFLFVLIQKSLEIGGASALRGEIAPWAGTWPTIAIVAVVSLTLFWRSASRVSTPPLLALSFDIRSLAVKLEKKIHKITPEAEEA
jgi:lipopolysaccharide export system permease protein